MWPSKSISFILVLFLTLSSLAAQQLRPSVDWAVFDYDAENVYLEIYYSFLQSDLCFEKAGDQLHGLTLGQFLVNRGEETVVSHAWKSETFVADSAALKQSKSIIDRIGLAVPIGEYRCQFFIQDLVHPQNSDTVSWAIDLSRPAAGVAHFSDIQLASTIRRAGDADKSSPFYKNSLFVEPNPTAMFSYEHPALFFYVEAYDLPVDRLPEGYLLKYYVINSDGAIPDGVKAKVVKKKQALTSSVEFGMLNVGNLKTGAYTFKVEIQDTERQLIAEQSKKFYVLQKEDLQNQQAVRQNTPYESSVFVSMDSADVEKEFLMVFYLLSKEEQTIHKELHDLQAKRHFLYNFWKNKYPDINVNVNPMRAEYYRRARHADDRFAAFKLEGWLTERGRVYMVYGEPDDVDRHPNEPNTYDHEIWFYNSLQNGVRFVFVDYEGHGNYRLIHSDLLGEIQDRNYKQLLIKAGF